MIRLRGVLSLLLFAQIFGNFIYNPVYDDSFVPPSVPIIYLSSCPGGCTCTPNAFGRPDIERTVVDCAYKGLTAIPSTIPLSTTELYMQGNSIHFFNADIGSTYFSSNGSPNIAPLTKLEVLR
jgi:hypothetical protein